MSHFFVLCYTVFPRTPPPHLNAFRKQGGNETNKKKVKKIYTLTATFFSLFLMLLLPFFSLCYPTIKIFYVLKSARKFFILCGSPAD